MRAADLIAADRRARLRYVYRPDAGDRDTWRSRADQVVAGERWSGDCDDLASTVLDLLGRDGQALEARYQLAVRSAAGAGPIDHLVACAVDDAGGFWIVGDTFGAAYPAAALRHQARGYHRLDEVDDAGAFVWRDGVPWSA